MLPEQACGQTGRAHQAFVVMAFSCDVWIKQAIKVWIGLMKQDKTVGYLVKSPGTDHNE